MINNQILIGDSATNLSLIPDNSVDCIVTSPPYYGLRDYGHTEQIGLEDSPAEYVSRLMEVFNECYRVLKPTGTMWINLGDSYSTSAQTGGLKPKNLLGIPWRVAFALQDAGWYLRQDIIWNKPGCMPESVKDRCTRSHEYVFLLTKSSKYYFDNEAIQEIAIYGPNEAQIATKRIGSPKYAANGLTKTKSNTAYNYTGFRNKRSVWTIPNQPFVKAHFAVFPELLAETCILAGCPENGVVLDPFAGSGTTGRVAVKNNRNYVLIELNPDYIQLIENRVNKLQVRLL